MSDLFAQFDPAATPLTAEEVLDLIPSHIAFRAELNMAEQENILRGQAWALSRRRELLTESFIKTLHKRMLGNVWRWAGKFRTSERNLGLPYWEIPVALRILLDDTKTWVKLGTYSPDEIAVRFHHRLVQIHPFANGNGRHSRLMADLLAIQSGRPRFSWGSASVLPPAELRAAYIATLKLADGYDLAPLIRFARG